jgi:hypothetical protein
MRFGKCIDFQASTSIDDWKANGEKMPRPYCDLRTACLILVMKRGKGLKRVLIRRAYQSHNVQLFLHIGSFVFLYMTELNIENIYPGMKI